MTHTPVRPKFNASISLGNMIQLAVILVSVTAGYVITQGRAEANQSRLSEIKQDFNELQSQFGALETRTRRVEQGNIRADERFNSILTILSRIDSRLERIEVTRNP